MSPGDPQKEINLMQLLSDVSRTLNGFKNLLIPPPAAAQNDASAFSGFESGLLSGDVCFKACGMEDIQLAAQV